MFIKKRIITRNIWVKGVGLPKNGVQICKEGETVKLVSENGVEWYIPFYYKGIEGKIATVPNTL